MAECSADMILRLGPDHRPRYISPSCEAIMGWSPEELMGSGPEKVIVAEDLHIFFEAVEALMAGKELGGVDTFRFHHKDGRILWGEASRRLLRDPATGKLGDMVVIIRDVTERKELEEKLSRMALVDVLTGLSNRRAFDEKLDAAWQQILRNAGHMSLLLIDIDHFKSFNDQYGHQVGDDALRAVAAALTGAFQGEPCTLARYGGEEIAVILPEVGARGAASLAERARISIEALGIPHAGNIAGGLVVTISTGAATAMARAGGTARMPEGLLAAADMALYKAKHMGRNRVETSLLLAPEGEPQPLQ
ncbi:GGDEF domain-containing protein [Bosea sp. 685]|uniref:GGDEF domain-containing protein n=1 Tax=Bosea sp. 685 TaxID=3080057 RepID=UPI002893814F|nr:diguanylate cyclase [Bosea sp. 685]WNJ88023.1 diguanylate cyclase [Bosea sp. 685]